MGQPYTAQFIAQVIGQALTERATVAPLDHSRQYMRLVARQLHASRTKQ